jgi:hypothetical protein
LETSLFAATVIQVAYGIDVQESDDPYISLYEEALNGLDFMRLGSQELSR